MLGMNCLFIFHMRKNLKVPLSLGYKSNIRLKVGSHTGRLVRVLEARVIFE